MSGDSSSSSPTAAAEGRSAHDEPAAAPPLYSLQDILGQGRRAVILHRNRRYLLTLTRRDRLILTLESTESKAQTCET